MTDPIREAALALCKAWDTALADCPAIARRIKPCSEADEEVGHILNAGHAMAVALRAALAAEPALDRETLARRRIAEAEAQGILFGAA